MCTSASHVILSRSRDPRVIIGIHLFIHSKFIYLIAGNKSCHCCLQWTHGLGRMTNPRFSQSEQVTTPEVVAVAMSGWWGRQGSRGQSEQLCIGSGVGDEQSKRPEEGKVRSFSEYKEKALCGSGWGFPHLCPHDRLCFHAQVYHIWMVNLGSYASLLRFPTYGMVDLGSYASVLRSSTSGMVNLGKSLYH